MGNRQAGNLLSNTTPFVFLFLLLVYYMKWETLQKHIVAPAYWNLRLGKEILYHLGFKPLELEGIPCKP